MIVDIGGMRTVLSEPVLDSRIFKHVYSKCLFEINFIWLDALNWQISTSESEGF